VKPSDSSGQEWSAERYARNARFVADLGEPVVELLDAYQLPFLAEFDAAFSNAALHWMREPDLVLAGVRRALRPRGRFVGEMGAQGNVAAISTAILAVLRSHGIDGAARWPWYFPTPAEYAERLETHGFVVYRLELIPRPTPLPTGMRGWLDTFADEERADILEEVAALLAPSLRGRAGAWTADYVRLRFAARLDG
jgi:SAM-dependent methyltransferase